MRSTEESSHGFSIHPHIYWIIVLAIILSFLIYTVAPTSLSIIVCASIVALLIHYLLQSMYFTKKTSLFVAFVTWGGIFLYIISAFNQLNSAMYIALVIALGIYLYR